MILSEMALRKAQCVVSEGRQIVTMVLAQRATDDPEDNSLPSIHARSLMLEVIGPAASVVAAALGAEDCTEIYRDYRFDTEMRAAMAACAATYYRGLHPLLSTQALASQFGYPRFDDEAAINRFRAAVEMLAAVLDAAEQQCGLPAEPLAPPCNTTARKPRRKRKRQPAPLTAKQIEAVHQVGECQGNLAEAARRLGIDRSTLKERYDAALAKLGKSEMVKPKTTGLKTDKRGQATVIAGDDRRG